MYQFIRLSIVIVLIFTGLIFVSTDTQPADLPLSDSTFHPLALPDSMQFAGESVPLHYFDVRENLDREIQVAAYFHSQSLLYLKRSKRYLPAIEKILKEQGIPEDFKYMPLIESALSNAVSPAGAVGYWQILKDTGIELGMEVNDEIDERYDFRKSTLAACKYLKESYAKYGSWTLAAASYNMGRRRLTDAIDKQQAGTFYDLWLNDETTRYIYRLLATKHLIENPDYFGVELQESDYYPIIQTKQVSVNKAITSWAGFAAEQQTNYRMLRYFNPWLRSYQLKNPSQKTYTLEIPLTRE
ncbi:MAG: lytic transglycosylase domain-containing protein [Bacteroidales bacterium]|nr:lytic transglycosylase domain-containing protein [Bacteroidales bacterium]